ncbi:hypothetical protein [Phytohabitans houttuyneae]|uniref:hypothetical protein n=1 Tax=Phytohabitans houttuyneae TaxID=1076126 RepID=UPI001565B101|nr:hypothetical protein [Phytohabitans houttuyneae]
MSEQLIYPAPEELVVAELPEFPVLLRSGTIPDRPVAAADNNSDEDGTHVGLAPESQ